MRTSSFITTSIRVDLNLISDKVQLENKEVLELKIQPRDKYSQRSLGLGGERSESLTWEEKVIN